MKRFYSLLTLLLCLFVASPPTATAADTDLAAGYYYIRSYKATDYYIHATLSGKLQTKTSDISGDPVYSAIWYVSEKGTDGTQTIKNIVTGTYIQSQSTNSSYYTLGSSSYGFTISCYTTSGDTNIYNVWSTYSTTSGNCRGLNLYYDYGVVAWNDPSDSGNQWTFTSISLTDSQLAEATALGSTDFSGWYKLSSKVSKYGIMKESDGVLIHEAASTTTSPEYAAIWNVTRTDWGYYTIQNAATGNYIQSQGSTDSQYATGTSTHSFYIVPNSSQSGYYNIFNTKGGNHINIRTWDSAVLAWTNSDCNAENCVWGFTDVSSDVTDAGILAARESYTGASSASSIKSGSYYQIYNPSRDTYLSISGIGADCNMQHLSKKTAGYTPYTQYWQVVGFNSSTGACTLKNVYTSKYMNNIPGGGRAYSCGDTGDTFYIVEGISLMPYVHIKQSTDATWMPHAEAGGAVVNWTAGSAGNISATEWLFKEVTLSSDDIAAAQADYSAAVTAINSTDTYNTALQKIFSDNACTTLRTDVSDTDFTTAYNALPSTLQTAVNKIKGTTDWDSYEKQFRIADYKPYSDPVKWRDIIGNSDQFSQLEQPTGIYVNEGDLIYVMADQAAPTDATLLVEILGENSATGSQTTLTAGLNVIRASQAGNVFVSYHCDTHSADTKKLADYANIKVHVEGGTLNGYFDTRTMTDDDWVAMQKAGLFDCTTINMVSDKLMFSMDGASVKKYTPVKLCELISVWDFIANTEDNLMGANDTYITNFSARCNNVFGMFSCNSGYMFATTYGTYYNKTTLSTVVNNDAMQVAYKNPSDTTRIVNAEAAGSPGTLWGPAHENGHLRQGLINIVGDTEVSNNVFSNVCLWERGYSTTRGNSVTTLLDQYNENNSRFYLDYPDGQDGSGCWDRTRMFWQLYLYYEVAGNHPNFYPELFAALRKDPMVRRNGSVTYGYENYLKFAKKCCEVSGDNLTDFFRVYGLFTPVENRYVDDYGNYYITCEQASIDSALTYMSQFKSGAENIIFIEDRIEYTQASFDGAADGDMRMDYESSVAIGKCGDVGSFTDYATTANVKASGYKYTIDDSGNVTIDDDASGAVGYKIYDASGNLVALYNTNSFTPTSTVLAGIKDGTYTVKAAQADGTCVEIPNSTSTYYTLTAYYGTSDAKKLYSTGKEAPKFTDANTVIKLDDSSAPATLTGASHVITKGSDGSYTTTADFTLTDKADFYSPVSFTATKLTYERTNTAGYNSVCLPFATTTSDYGTSSVIYAMGQLASDKSYICITPQESATAGSPVLVYCPDDVTTWSITKENVTVVGEPTSNAGTDATLLGSFTNETIGANYYKLNSTGTAFGITTDAGKVFAFRSYMQLNNSDSNAARIAVRIGDEATGINTVNAATEDNNAWYDLQGRRVLAPTQGIYIHNGRKVIVR